MFPPLEKLFSHSDAISFSLVNAFQFTVMPDMSALYFYISLSLLYCKLLEEEIVLLAFYYPWLILMWHRFKNTTVLCSFPTQLLLQNKQPVEN